MSEPADHTNLAARTAALDALSQVLDSHQPLEAALEGSRGFPRLSTRDRAFARLLAATALRHRGELDALIGARVDRPLPPPAPPSMR